MSFVYARQLISWSKLALTSVITNLNEVSQGSSRSCENNKCRMHLCIFEREKCRRLMRMRVQAAGIKSLKSYIYLAGNCSLVSSPALWNQVSEGACIEHSSLHRNTHQETQKLHLEHERVMSRYATGIKSHVLRVYSRWQQKILDCDMSYHTVASARTVYI